MDTRLEFMSEYILKSLKQKIEKWTKFITGDERVIVTIFFIFIELPYLRIDADSCMRMFQNSKM